MRRVLFTVFPQANVFVIKLLAVTALGVLIWLDLRDRRLPAHWVGLVAGLYFALAAVQRTPLPQIATHVLIAGLACAMTAAMFSFGWMGGGDVKLSGAVFLWAGPHATWAVLCVISLAGLPLALLMLALRRLPHASPRQTSPVLQCFEVERGVPYGVALACGGIWAIFVT